MKQIFLLIMLLPMLCQAQSVALRNVDYQKHIDKSDSTLECDIRYHGVLPADRQLEEAFFEALFRDLTVDNIPIPGTTFEQVSKAWADTFLVNFVYVNPDDYPWPVELLDSIILTATYNQNCILTMSEESINYTGGAHGMYGTALVSIDTQKKHVLTLDDLFLPGYEKPFYRLLKKQVKKQTDRWSSAPSAIEINDNYGIQSEGLVFIYNPYEIASYAEGMFVLLIPKKTAQRYLRPAYRLIWQ